eukprot:CAMPEP_0182422496 /NCGR_PEP_ID=MMETSP1167-20130531/8215_1 /TAXON_ID=2988 /ORGANISM="Mallomonas Sp, Strain CCMP3275" /LENGTH=569 /DNA_ID=CAMNT_0024600627 /DNA_START=547 /DNA_END=2256 /DNA_ORIENTATION=+
MILRWFINLKKKPFIEMTSNEYSCCIYFVVSMLSGLAIICLFLLSGGVYDYNTPAFYLVGTSYVVAGFMVTIAIFHIRLAVVEVIRTQQDILNMKRSFVRFVSHEIRTPLNTVVVGLELLKDLTSIDSEGLLMIEDLSFSCNIAIDTLNDLLNYEKVESGLMTLDCEQILFIPLIEKAMKPFYIQARHADVTLKLNNNIENSTTLPCDVLIKIDECKISQVIRNLISNALKFTPERGCISVNVDVFSSNEMVSKTSETRYIESSSQKWLCIEVVDTGAGISQENLPRVFREMIQFSPGKLQRGGGSGLGLWISRAIVDMHGGRISVHSDGEGCGCKFKVELPLDVLPGSEEEVAAQEAPRNSRAHGSRVLGDARVAPIISVNAIKHRMSGSSSLIPTRPSSMVDHIGNELDTDRKLAIENAVVSFRTTDTDDSKHQSHNCRDGLRVLAVDDAAVNLKMICRGLGRLGYKDTAQATNGEKALSLVQEAMDCGNPFHVVLMDYQMPIMDGPTAAKKMREIGYVGKIYGLTGNALNRDIDYYLSQGADEVFTKPISIKKLDHVILANHVDLD